MKRNRFFSIMVILALTLGSMSVLPAQAAAEAICNWKSDAASTDWATATNWDCGAVPGNGDTAYIGSSTNPPLITTAVGGGTSTLAVVIQNGGILTLGGAAGTFQPLNLTIEGGGKYIHNRGTSHPFLVFTTRSFLPNSTVELQALGVLNIPITFGGHLIVNNPATIQFSGYVTSIGGDFTKQGAGALRLATTANVSLTIGGDLDIQGGSVTIQSTATTNTANVTANGNVSLASGTTLARGLGTGAFTFNVAGNWTNNGATFTPGTSTTVVFNGGKPQTIGGSSPTTFNNLTVLSPSSGGVTDLNFVTFPVVSGTFAVDKTNNKVILRQDELVNAGTVSFFKLGSYRGVDVTSAGDLGTVNIIMTLRRGTDYCTSTGLGSPAYALRCYEITATSAGGATLMFYLDTLTELNGLTVGLTTPAIYRYSGGWNLLTSSTGTSGNYTTISATTPGFSSFLVADANNAPTAVSLIELSARQNPGSLTGLLALSGLGLLAGLGMLIWRKRNS